MHQLNTWGMTGNTETFRQGVTAYRNARDWAKEQRDKAIRRANERVDLHHAAADAGFQQASSFAGDATSDGTYTIEASTEESPASPTKNTNTTSHLKESESSLDELVVDYVAQVKRSKEHVRGSPQSRRKRRNVGAYHDFDSQQSEPQLSMQSGLSQQFDDQVLAQGTSSQSNGDDLHPGDVNDSREIQLPKRNRNRRRTGGGGGGRGLTSAGSLSA